METAVHKLYDATIRLVQALEATVILGETAKADPTEFSLMLRHLGKLKSEAVEAAETVQEYYKELNCH